MTFRRRRDFMKTVAGAAGATLLPESIRRALAVPAAASTGTIADVEHIVVFMQENRSFDHYFGHLRGVRGYNDRFPVTLPGGKPVWFQPSQENAAQPLLPFHLDTHHTSAQCVGDLDHTWAKTQAAIANGRYDQWPANKTDMTMGYYLRADLPFHYALADAFTVCDQYFCSIPAQTHPNRLYLMTGMVDPGGAGGGPVLDNNDTIDLPRLPPFTWTTYPERLEKAGISWQVYQQGLDYTDNYSGNYGTNVLADFRQFIEAPAGSPLHQRGMSVRSLDALAKDVAADALPQVSWLLPPAAFSEHPNWTPGYGAAYTSRILDALTSNPKVWSKTVLFIMYDENDGFFDHVVPPQAPTLPHSGKSTVTLAGEVHDYVNPSHAPLYSADHLPFGLGPRVPMTVVSPWTKGGYVCSQVFDHTSVIRFIETRFGVREPNITPWRRAVCGDLSAAFNFAHPDASPPSLPDTGAYMAVADTQCKTLPAPHAPAGGAGAPTTIVPQEPGVRPARALPYEVQASAAVDAARQRLVIDFTNTGQQGAHFLVYAGARADGPWRYTVEAGKQLSDSWSLSGAALAYAFTVYGPNGFMRRFAGNAAAGALEVGLRYDAARGNLRLILSNHESAKLGVEVRDNAYGQMARTHVVPGHARIEDSWDLSASAQWYDLSVSLAGQPAYLRRMAGHVETGRVSTSDPAAVAPTLRAV